MYRCDRGRTDFTFLLMGNGGFRMSFPQRWIQRGIYSITLSLQSTPMARKLRSRDPHHYHVPPNPPAFSCRIAKGNVIGHEPEVQKDVWTRKIPSYVARIPDSPNYNGRYSSRSSLTDDDVIPPALPRQLEKPFLNQNHVQKDDQSVLPQPAHVSSPMPTHIYSCRLF